MRVVDHESVLHVLFEALVSEDLCSAHLGAVLEAIGVVVLIMLAESYHSVDAEGLPDHHLQVGVELGYDEDRLLEVIQVHDDLVLEEEFLTRLSINILLLDELVHQEHVWAMIPVIRIEIES